MNENNFELRELKSCDIFPMSTILSKIGVKEIKNSFDPETIKALKDGFNGEGQIEKYIGISIVTNVLDLVLKNLPKAKDDIYSFLAGLSGMTVEELEDMSMVTFTELIVAVIKKDEFKDFFKVVSGLFK